MMPGDSPDSAANVKDFPGSSPLTGGERESVPPAPGGRPMKSSPLSPGDVQHKYYARGVGFILDVQVKGGSERSELVRIQRGD